MKIIFYSAILAFLFIGCSSKQYFEPEQTDGNYTNDILSMESSILNYTPYGMTLENNRFISKSGITDMNTTKKIEFLNDNNGVILAFDHNETLFVKDKQKLVKQFKFDKDIVSATIKNNLIALVFVDNSIGLFDSKTKTMKFKEYLKKSIINDIKIAAPIFLSSMILYPTLDGKIVIYNIKLKKIIKTINIDPSSNINNIISLNAIDDTLIAATSKKLFTFNNSKVNVKDFDITNLIIKGNYIYITTLDGQILKFNKDLEQLTSVKFKFAKFYTLGSSSKYIYALESQDYLIQLSLDLKEYTVYDLSFYEDEKVKIIKDKLYFGNEYIKLK